MIVDVECERCRGEGWLLTREPRLGSGLYETTCPKSFVSGTKGKRLTYKGLIQ